MTVVRLGAWLDAPAEADLRALVDRARAVVTGSKGSDPDLDRTFVLARDLGSALPRPATGRTLVLWESLATLGALDLTVARVVEPHLDALAILAEAKRADLPVPENTPPEAVWGVFAAEGGPRLLAHHSAGRWTLSGSKPWCSLGDKVSHALLTAWVDDDERGIFAVDMSHPGVRPRNDAGAWAARGLVQVRSTGLDLAEVPAFPVGGPGWYLRRPGFAWGGIGVAAVWYGATVALARRIRGASQSREPDQVALVHLGLVDAALARARAVLLDAATVVDGPPVAPAAATRLALRARQVVADAAEEVLNRAGHALGPGPLALEEDHARRVSDLALYVRQHHAERDAAALGRAALGERNDGDWTWW